VGCTGGPLWRALLWLLPGVAATAVFSWAGLHASLAAGWLLPMALLAGALAALVASRSLPARRQLGWDGGQWTCGGQPVRPQVLIDIGPWLLIRLWPGADPSAAAPITASGPAGALAVAAGSARWLITAARLTRQCTWLAVSLGDAGPAWHALRVALYSKPAAPDAGVSARQPP
jgi:hypothetical protein